MEGNLRIKELLLKIDKDITLDEACVFAVVYCCRGIQRKN